ncbi:MAG: ATP-grasp domain-containing protein [Anaerolineae bacterium]|nr:ATP-grasp domain-containing protein [Anaerolineae bacterium]
MNILLLSPYFPPNWGNFARALNRVEANVFGLGDEPYDALSTELKSALTEYYRVSDLHKYDQLVRACGYFTHKYGKLDRIESHNEYWLATDAALRTDFNVPGPKTADISLVKNKSRMKEIFRKAGIAVAPGQLVKDQLAAVGFAESVGYPVVVKPDIGVGASATHKFKSEDELICFFNDKPATEYLIEKFIAGKLYSFDGLTDQHGNIVFCTSHFFSQGIMEIVNEQLDMFYYSMRSLPDGLEEVGRKAVRAFDVRERFFHIEFFQVSPGDWVALEINMRPPGGLTMDMFNYANDIDLYQEWANIIVNNSFSTEYTRPYHCAYIGRTNHRPYVLSHDDIISQYRDTVVYYEQMSPILAPALGNYGYVVRTPDLKTLQSIITALMA